MTDRAVLARVGIAALVLIALVAAVRLADDHRRVIDLTEDATLTLAPQTEDVVGSIDRDVEITLFARASEPGRVEAVSLLDRYRRLERRITVSVVDPDDSPGEVSRAGVDPLTGGVVVRAGGRTEVIAFPTEGELTGALARLLRDEPTTVCLTTGHGERSPEGTGGLGIRRLVDLLGRDGLDVRTLDLLAEPSVPAVCDVLLVAAPSGTFGAATTRAVTDWVDDDGRLLLLTDPTAEAGILADLLEDLGLRIEPGVVFEGDAGNVVGGDVAAPIVTRYPSAHPITRRLAPTFFPLVQEVAVVDGGADSGLTTTALATTSPTSYLERNPVTPDFDPAEDRPGPITVVAAADRSRVEGSDVRRTRVVVTGDADFASDDAIGEAGNAQLIRRSVAWLAETEDLVAISPNLPADRPLRLTDARLRYARFLGAGAVPALFLLAGVMVWALRRAR